MEDGSGELSADVIFSRSAFPPQSQDRRYPAGAAATARGASSPPKRPALSRPFPNASYRPTGPRRRSGWRHRLHRSPTDRPLAEFQKIYRLGIAGVEQTSLAQFSARFVDLAPEERQTAVLAAMEKNKAKGENVERDLSQGVFESRPHPHHAGILWRSPSRRQSQPGKLEDAGRAVSPDSRQTKSVIRDAGIGKSGNSPLPASSRSDQWL